MSRHLDNTIWTNPNYPNPISPDEDVILMVREDLAIIIYKAVGLYSIYFVLLLLRLFFEALSFSLWLNIYDFALNALGALLVAVFIIIFHNYYLSLQVITTERIIDIDQTGLFKREINSTYLDTIQDVTDKKTNLLQLFFNYGNVTTQTSGRTGSEGSGDISGFVFNNVPNPSDIAHLIQVLISQGGRDKLKQAAKYEAAELQQILNRKSFL